MRQRFEEFTDQESGSLLAREPGSKWVAFSVELSNTKQGISGFSACPTSRASQAGPQIFRCDSDLQKKSHV